MSRYSSRSRPRCFGQVANDRSVNLEAVEANHLFSVLRLKAGDEVEVVDEGRLYRAEVRATSQRRFSLHCLEELRRETFGALSIRFFPSLLHSVAMERLTRLAVELHVARISPVMSQRTQTSSRVGRFTQRLRRIARESCKQSRRVIVPPVDDPVSLDQCLEEARRVETLRLCLSPSQATVDWEDLKRLSRPEEVWLLQGPEGGWSGSELEKIEQAGFSFLQLGRAVFRAETCPLVSVVLLHFHFGELFQTL